VPAFLASSRRRKALELASNAQQEGRFRLPYISQSFKPADESLFSELRRSHAGCLLPTI
jgi:hypothetical protein